MSNASVQTTNAPSVPNQGMTPVVAVVVAVADAAGTDPLELPPLHEAINPEALNELIDCDRESGLQSISFEYAGYDVVVSGTGDVHVTLSE
ncbi:HalOD1 output domain-containing protein [Natronococcus occultus]|uniref:Halobacterial output domain-containing protein n=1 Tax=Natronococcus occultus SP4 TaxID=694430 RepID=L0K681_9EURY|nr:HalOD1 output domain-containing protein [Natronococcus occultus]AGB39864.1 hypothetical protein Natoc_4158 [Natronococcus occultus SP4]